LNLKGMTVEKSVGSGGFSAAATVKPEAAVATLAACAKPRITRAIPTRGPIPVRA
jgi:hypothetical protein